MKTDPRRIPNFGIQGYTTGVFKNTCQVCDKRYTGGKRSIRCLPCALKYNKEQLKALIIPMVDWRDNEFVI